MTNKVIFWLDADITNFSISYYLQKISGAEFYAIIDTTNKPKKRSEERRVGKECRSRWSPYH